MSQTLVIENLRDASSAIAAAVVLATRDPNSAFRDTKEFSGITKEQAALTNIRDRLAEVIARLTQEKGTWP